MSGHLAIRRGGDTRALVDAAVAELKSSLNALLRAKGPEKEAAKERVGRARLALDLLLMGSD
jgi:hypothetical protein